MKETLKDKAVFNAAFEGLLTGINTKISNILFSASLSCNLNQGALVLYILLLLNIIKKKPDLLYTLDTGKLMYTARKLNNLCDDRMFTKGIIDRKDHESSLILYRLVSNYLAQIVYNHKTNYIYKKPKQ